MATLYRNFLAGTITDAPLTNVATTINSANFANLPVVAAPDIMWITLDPDAVDGAPEIVKVTAHSSSATSITVVREQQGTTARQHAVDTDWRHSATQTDLESILVPAGTIRATVKSTADDGWLLFGQTVTDAQTLYPALWAAAPAAWQSGADLVLPDLDDTILIGAGSIAALGATGGANTATIAEANLPAHTHSIDHNHASATTSSDGAHTHTVPTATSFAAGQFALGDQTSSPSGTINTSSDGAHTHTLDLPNFTGTSGSTGSGTALSIAQLSVGVIFQIKAH